MAGRPKQAALTLVNIRAFGKEEPYHLSAVPSCTRVYQAVLGCTRLYQAVPGCTWLYQAVRLQQAVLGP